MRLIQSVVVTFLYFPSLISVFRVLHLIIRLMAAIGPLGSLITDGDPEKLFHSYAIIHLQ